MGVVTFRRAIATFWTLFGSNRLDSRGRWELEGKLLEGDEGDPLVLMIVPVLTILKVSSNFVKSRLSIIFSSSSELKTVPETCVDGIDTQLSNGNLCLVCIFLLPWITIYTRRKYIKFYYWYVTGSVITSHNTRTVYLFYCTGDHFDVLSFWLEIIICNVKPNHYQCRVVPTINTTIQ